MASKTSRGGMFGSLKSLVRGTSTRSKISGKNNTNTNPSTTRKSESTINLQAPPPKSTNKASNSNKTGAGGASDNSNNTDSSPSSQSSFFSDRTGDASLSSGASTPVGPESLSPAPLSSTRSHPNKPAKKTRAGGGGHVVGNGGGGKGEAGAPPPPPPVGPESLSPAPLSSTRSHPNKPAKKTRAGGGGHVVGNGGGGTGVAPPPPPPRGAYRARSSGNHTETVGRYDDHDDYVGDDAAAGLGHDHDSGGGGKNQPQLPSYESLFLSRRPRQGHEAFPAGGEVAASASAAPSPALCSRSRDGTGKRSSSARYHSEIPRRNQQQPQPHILRKKQSKKSSGNRGSSGNFTRVRRAAATTTRGGSGGGAVAHMSPAERAALREAEEEGIADLDQQQQQQQQQEYMPQYRERGPGGRDDDGGGGPSDEAAEQEAPRRQQVGVPDMEKAYIRSLAEINAGVVAGSNRLRPLLTDIPRQHLYGAIPTLGGASTKKVAVGHKKTLVLDLDETLVSSSRTPCDCDYKIVFKIHTRERPGADDTFANAPGGSNKSSSRGGPAESGDETIREIHYFVRLRPGLAKFLQKVAAIYELVIWTASGQSYADAIIDLLDPTGELFSARLYRDSCLRYHNLCVKDLRRLGRPMNAVLLLDNYVYSFGLTLDNGVPISPWTGEKEAKASGLAAAYSLLRGASRFPDVRNPLITAFDLHRKVHGHPSAAAAASSATTGGGSRHQRQQRSRFHNPLSPVASCSAMSSASSSPSSSTSSSMHSSDSPASTTTAAAASPVDFFSGSRVAPPRPSSRGAPVGAEPLSSVAVVWAANAAARAEEERMEAQRSSSLRSTSLRSTSLRSTEEEAEPRRQQQKKPKQRQQRGGGAKKQQQQQQQGEQEKTTMQAKLAEQVREAKEDKRAQQLLQQQQQQQRQRQRQQLAAATKTVKRGTSGEGGTGLSPVVARWAAGAAVRAQKEAKAARAAAALME